MLELRKKEGGATVEFENNIKTSNGVNVYFYKNPALHGFYISLFVRAGVMYEDEKYSGITHFFEHAAIRNVNKLYGMNLYSMLDKYGIDFNASTFSEMVQFYVSGADRHFDIGAEIISKLLEPITLAKSEIDAERKRIKAEIRESDEKSSLASFTNKIVFDNTSLASSIVGTNASIDRVSAAALEKYRKDILTTENIFFYVTGSFTESDIKSLCEKIERAELLLGEKRDNTAPVPNNFGKRDGEIHVKNADFALVRFTFDLDMSRYSIAEMDILYDILLSGYNSKLFVEMSENRGLFYDISGASERYKNIGTLHFSFEVKDKDIPESVAIVVDILNSLKENLLDDRECMKAEYVDNAYMLYDDSRELNFTFSYDNHIMGANYSSVEDRKNAYSSVTPSRIREIASEIFRQQNLTLTMKAKSKLVDKQKIKDILWRLK